MLKVSGGTSDDANSSKRQPQMPLNPSYRSAEVSVFELIFHNTFNFIALLDVAGTLLEVNRPALAFAGRTRAEMTGQSLWQLAVWSAAARPLLEAAVARGSG